jgi:Holliday junction resolvase
VIGYTQGKTYAFNVKGSCRDRVYLNCFGNELQNAISNARSHNALPFIAFPRNNVVQLTNPEYWFLVPLSQYSYLLTLSSNPAYKKLVEQSQKLTDLKTIELVQTT